MGSYKILFKKSVAKDFRKIPGKDRLRIIERIGQLAQDPRPPDSAKLSGEEKYRIRQGSYRILYKIFDPTITITIVIVKVVHRKDVYR